MRNNKLVKYLSVLFLCIISMSSAAFSAENIPHPDTYVPGPSTMKNIKKSLDDPTDLMSIHPFKKALPPEIYGVLETDIEEAKRQWAEIVGFKSPEVVGKIAPEIKPGKYTYQDLEKYPGLKELFFPEYLQNIKPGGSPFVGSIPEFEIIPTKQLYWSLRVCEATKRNQGKTELDKDGYIVPGSWQGGIPFPRPSGKFKAQQLLYSFLKRPDHFERCLVLQGESRSFDCNLNMDRYNLFSAHFIRLMGRTLFPPYGWFDERAKKNGESEAFSVITLEPRASRGTVVLQYMYDDPNKMDPWVVYVPSLRRIRKMSATDTQDPLGDQTYDDREYLSQKITPQKFPYEFNIIGEREYLLAMEYDTAKAWINSKNGYALRNAQFMRRPCYVLELKQMDPNYIYSRRILYVDKENFMACFSANYDQKGRLYRTSELMNVFLKDMGQITGYGSPSFQRDHVDLHSTYQMHIQFPASFSREDFSMEYLIKMGK